MPRSLERIRTEREERYEPLREILDKLERVTEGSRDNWWFRTVLILKRLERSVNDNPEQYPESMVQFVHEVMEPTLELLKGELGAEGNPIARAHELVLQLSESLPETTPPKEEEVEVHSINLDEIVNLYSQVEYAEWNNGSQRKALKIYDSQGNGHLFPLINHPGILHKGGFPRVLLKIIADADQDLIDAELPPNDFDIIALKEIEDIEKRASELGVDPDGIEHVANFDLEELFVQRDIDLNNCFIGEDELYYSDQAVQAVQTGKIRVMSSVRTIYGSEHFVYGGEVLLKNRGLMRLFKTVVEGKATHFEFTPLNEQVEFGIYWLVMCRKFLNKDETALYLDRLRRLAEITGQIPSEVEEAVNKGEVDEDKKIIAVLDYAHEEYPFFDFHAGPLDEEGVVRWLSGKLIKQADRAYRHNYHIPNELVMEREPGDTEPYTVSLDDYKPDEKRLAKIEGEIERFLQRCKKRTRKYKELSKRDDLIEDD